MGSHHRLVLRLLLFVVACLGVSLAGHKGHHNNNKLIELLTAGIVAKVLQKNDDHEGGGHHGYYAVPIPVHHHGHHHSGRAAAPSTHVTEKIIPIPVPHHTTRIIHINAGSHGIGGGGGEGGGGGFSPGGGFGGYGDGGGDGYGDSSYDRPGAEIDGGDYQHQDDQSHQHSPTVQQIMFHDGGVYGMPQPPHRPPVLVRGAWAGASARPMMGMVHQPQPLRMAAGMVPHVPVMAAAHHPMVRVRHYYPLASGRHRMLAYPPPQPMMAPYNMRYRPPQPPMMPYQTMMTG